MTEESKDNEDKSTLPIWLYIALGFVIATAVGVLSTYFSQFNDKLGDQNTFGLFGDFVGGTLNPLLGFFTVALLIWSIKIQRDELSLARAELAKTAEATLESSSAMRKQIEHIEKETQLNELMRLINEQMGEYNELISRPMTTGLSRLLATSNYGNRCTYKHFLHPNEEMRFAKQANKERLEAILKGQETRFEEDAAIISEITFTVETISSLVSAYAELSNHLHFKKVYFEKAFLMIQSVIDLPCADDIVELQEYLEAFRDYLTNPINY